MIGEWNWHIPALDAILVSLFIAGLILAAWSVFFNRRFLKLCVACFAAWVAVMVAYAGLEVHRHPMAFGVPAGAQPQGSSQELIPDATLVSQFRSHRGDFETLASKAVADSQLVGAGHDPLLMRFDVFVRDTPQKSRMLPDEDVLRTGRSEYRKLLDRVGAPAISRLQDGSAVRFVVMTRGRVRKGFLYTTKAPTRLYKRLDGLEMGRYFYPGYRSLAPRWYIFVEPRL